MTRLIDADELRELYNERNNFDTYNDYSFVVDTLDYMPTIDAETVRHGKWIEDGSFKYKHGGRNSDVKELFGTEWRTMRRIKCSLCNKITLVDETILYEYCPHCGAKMGD